MTARRYLAFDLGAESGRAVVGTLQDGRLSLEEIHRFLNEPVEVCGTLHWDILALYNNILKGMREYVKRYGDSVDGIGIDTWAVDFALFGRDGRLLQNPVCYRDRRTEGMVDKALERMSAAEIYEETGMAILSIHTIFQLLALRLGDSPVLSVADLFLMIPSTLGYFLTGEKQVERSNAISTQVYNPRSGRWSEKVFSTYDLPLSIMPKLVDPGTRLGPLLDGVKDSTGLRHGDVISVCNHDTGSAVAAVPAEGENWAFISSGTWSILGALSPQVITTQEAFEARMVNELTVGSLFLARNIMGLWLLQQSRASWARAGQEYSYGQLVEMAAAAPADGPLIFPDHLSFLAPADMPTAIADYCRRTGQKPPEGPAAITRCILESLALIYREDLEKLAGIQARRFDAVHVVGGGSQNALLCRFTANASGIPVVAGPVEATVAGSILVQALATGGLSSAEEIRRVVRDSNEMVRYEPTDKAAWDAKFAKYMGLDR